MNKIYNYTRIVTFIPLLVLFTNLYAQEKESTDDKINNFSAVVTVQSKGISTIPNLTLGKPAASFDLKVGRRLSFEPQFRFSLEGKPWASVFWWRYQVVNNSSFKLTTSINYALSYKTIEYLTSGTTQDIIRTTRYFTGTISPNYQINKYLGAGVYFFYAKGIEKFITQNTYMASFRPSITNIPITKDIKARIGPQVYYLNMDKKNGTYFNTTFLLSKTNFPVTIGGLVTKPLKSNIPSEYDFLWKVELIYTFSKKYKEMN